MNVLHRAGAFVAALLLLIAAAAAGYAQQETAGDSSVSITGNAQDNYLSIQITAGNFAARPFSFDDQLTNGTLTVSVTDKRGTNAGWGVNISGGTFTGPSGTFAISNLGLVPGAPQAVVGECGAVTTATGQSASAIAQVSGSPARIWTASRGSGSGCFQLPVSSSLSIPGGTLIGEYTARITVSIAAAP